MTGNKVLNYTIGNLIEEGGMGAVYHGTDEIERRVAIKVLHPHLAKTESIRKRFLNEAKTMSKLDHPGIVRMLNYTEQNNYLFLIMEYVEGTALDNYITKVTGPIPEERVVPIFNQILSAVQYAHNLGIVHRDIKPSNFIISATETVKILDFGIAKVLDSEDYNLTSSGDPVGTILYMSPEQAEGQAVDARSDIYSLGVTLFQMITGTHPYANEKSKAKLYNNIIKEPLPPARSLYPAVSDHIQAVIDKATAKNPANRFASCADFMAALNTPQTTQKQKTQTADYAKTTIANSLNQKPDLTKTQKTATTTRQQQTADTQKKAKKKDYTMYIIVAVLAVLLVWFFGFYKSDNNTNSNTADLDTVTITDTENEITDETEVIDETDATNEVDETEEETTITDNNNNYSGAFPRPTNLNEYLNAIGDPEYAYKARVNLIPRCIKQYFENNEALVERSKSGVVTDYYTIQDYLDRLAINEISSVTIVNKQQGNTGKIETIRVEEY